MLIKWQCKIKLFFIKKCQNYPSIQPSFTNNVIKMKQKKENVTKPANPWGCNTYACVQWERRKLHKIINKIETRFDKININNMI